MSSAIYPLFSCSTLHCGKRLNFSNNLMKNFSLRNVLSWFSICQRYQKDQHFSQRTDLFTKHRDSTIMFSKKLFPKKRSLKRSNANLLGSGSVMLKQTSMERGCALFTLESVSKLTHICLAADSAPWSGDQILDAHWSAPL